MEELTIKNVKEKLIEIIEAEFLCQLEKDNKRYYKEASIQCKLGNELYKKFGTDPVFEWSVPHIESDLKIEKRSIDIMIEIGGKKVAIELKYKTKGIENQLYINQGAQNNGKFDFFEDIQRLEELKDIKDKKFHIEKGFAILITNDHLYWNPAGQDTYVKPFNLCDDKGIKEDTYYAKWKKAKEQKEDEIPAVTILRPHEVKWFPPISDKAKKDGKTFRCLIIEI